MSDELISSLKKLEREIDILKAFEVPTKTSMTFDVLPADPILPAQGRAWVLRTPPSVTGSPIGLLLALTQGATNTYQLSVMADGTVRRVAVT